MLLEKRVPLAARNGPVRTGFDALSGRSDFGPVFLAQIMQGVRNLVFAESFPNQARERAAFETPQVKPLLRAPGWP